MEISSNLVAFSKNTNFTKSGAKYDTYNNPALKVQKTNSFLRYAGKKENG